MIQRLFAIGLAVGLISSGPLFANDELNQATEAPEATTAPVQAGHPTAAAPAKAHKRLAKKAQKAKKHHNSKAPAAGHEVPSLHDEEPPTE